MVKKIRELLFKTEVLDYLYHLQESPRISMNVLLPMWY